MDDLQKSMCESAFNIPIPSKDGLKKRDPRNTIGRAMELVEDGKLTVEITKTEYKFTPV